MKDRLIFRECKNVDCGLRFPDYSLEAEFLFCPMCGEPTLAAEFVKSPLKLDPPDCSKSSKEIIVFLDNIRSAYNVGSIMRICDAFGVSNVITGGITPTHENPKVRKTSLGAEENLHINSARNGLQFIEEVKHLEYFCVGMELSPLSISINKFQRIPSKKLIIILGDEKFGIDPAIQNICDLLVEVPMNGAKESLNVAVSCGIVLYQLCNFVEIVS